MVKLNVKKICISAIFVALCYVLTTFVSIPLSSAGYINLSDFFVVFTTLSLDPVCGLIVSVIAPSLADLTLGYYLYIPFTILAKGLECILIYLIFYKVKGGLKYPLLIIPAFVMAAVYFIPDIIVLGSENYISCFINLGFNTLQGVVGLILGISVRLFLKKIKLLDKIG